MFKTRLISGIILVIIALAVIITGGDVLLAVLGLISVIGMYELNRVFGVEKELPGLLSYVTTIVYFLQLRFSYLADVQLIFVAFLILLLAIYVFTYPKYKADQIIASFFGLFYVAIMLSFIYQLRSIEGGFYLVWLIFLCSWGSDTCAYCVGMLFGKHKMSPILSPKKSVEGAIGGVAGAALLTLIYSLIFADQMSLTTINIIVLCITAMITALVSMVGDLAASAIKRNYDIKDYGTLIPGHGGILDRFDSVIIVAPIVYYMVVLLM